MIAAGVRKHTESSSVQTRLPSRQVTRPRQGGSSSSPTKSQSPHLRIKGQVLSSRAVVDPGFDHKVSTDAVRVVPRVIPSLSHRVRLSAAGRSGTPGCRAVHENEPELDRTAPGSLLRAGPSNEESRVLAGEGSRHRSGRCHQRRGSGVGRSRSAASGGDLHHVELWVIDLVPADVRGDGC
jgi:hypothetical protein